MDTQIILDELDFVGNPRIFENTQIDIGAFETTSTEPAMESNFFGSDIINFQIPDQEEIVIDGENHTILITMPDNTDVTNLTPEIIEVSFAADINPGEGDAQDFSDPFIYQVIAGNGIAQDWTVTVQSIILGIEENLKDRLSIYPNPSSGNVFLELNSAIDEEITISIYSLNGASIISPIRFEKNTNMERQFLDLKNVASGLYMITIQAGGKLETLKLVKQ